MKKKILLLPLALQSLFIFCQAPEIEWQVSYGGLDWDASRQVRPMPDGSYMITAFTNSFDGDVIDNHGNDMWIYKVDSVGNMIWQKCFGGSVWEEPYDLHPTSDGGYIIAGESDSEDGDVNMNHGERDFWLVKIDSVGNIQWQNKYGGSLREIPYGLEFTPDGGYMICGKTFSNDGDVSGHHGPSTEYDIWIIKTDSVGNLEWQKSYGGSREEIARDIQATNDGNYLIYGWAESTDGDVVGLHGDRKDYWLFEIDPDGNMLWQKCIGGSDDEFGYSFQIDTVTETIFLGGYSRSNDGDVSGNHGGFSDGWVVRTDMEGNILWQKCFGGSERDYSRYIHLTPDHGAIISAYSSSSDGDLLIHYGEDYQADYWLVKMDSNGVMQWQKTIGGSDNDECYGISMTIDSGYIVTGWSVNDDIDLTFNHGYRDVWLVKLEKPCTQNKFFIDGDTDGFGDASNYTYSCDATLDGYVLNDEDCNDLNNMIHPGAEDLCNGFDENCNGIMDDDAVYELWYEDADGDLFGSLTEIDSTCDGIPPAGFISLSGDCDDTNELINPDQSEICNYIDENCNGIIDDDFLYLIYFEDFDSDDFGNPDVDSVACSMPDGFTNNDDDCDDTNAAIHPDAFEIFNGIDDNCNDSIDEGLVAVKQSEFIFSIAPNPASDVIAIELNAGMQMNFEIFTLTGQKLYAADFINAVQLNISFLTEGIYILQLHNDDLSISRSFIINR